MKKLLFITVFLFLLLSSGSAIEAAGAEITISVNEDCAHFFGDETLLVNSCNTINQVISFIPVPSAVLFFFMGTYIAILSYKTQLAANFGLIKWGLVAVAFFFIMQGMGVF